MDLLPFREANWDTKNTKILRLSKRRMFALKPAQFDAMGMANHTFSCGEDGRGGNTRTVVDFKSERSTVGGPEVVPQLMLSVELVVSVLAQAV